jgi:copper oxidase (laccase) domain-containing protein
MTLPTPGRSFEWRQHAGRPALVCRPLLDVAAHLFTTSVWRLGSRVVRDSGRDDWEEVARTLSLADSRLVRARQVHGTKVVIGTAAVAAVHAGWRGMMSRAPQVAVAAFIRECGARAEDLRVALGPSIGACCYEVGPEVRDACAAAGFPAAQLQRWFSAAPRVDAANPPMPQLRTRRPRTDRWFFDGWSATREQLVEVGVPVDQVFSAAICTASHPEVCCSYRRDGAPAGRLVGAIRSRSVS